VEDWLVELNEGRPEAAWDSLLTQYRRLIFGTISRYAQDYDDVMDIFADVCHALRVDDFRRLRGWGANSRHTARFSTWLVTVVRNLTIDWFRSRDGRRRLSRIGEGLPPLRRQIFELVFTQQRSHVEAYELLRSGTYPDLPFRTFLIELRVAYQAVTAGRRGRILRELGHAPVDDDGLETTDPAEGVGRGAAIQRMLDGVAPVDRAALLLYVVDELPAAEIARVVGLPDAKAVYNRVYRALASLRKRLAAEGIEREDL